MLTRAQHQLLTFIADFTKANGWAPSYDEMRAGMGLASKSGINRLMEALIERGFVTKRRDRARAIEVIRMPGDVGPKKVVNADPALLDTLRALVAWAEDIEEQYKEEWGSRDDDAPEIVNARALIARLDGTLQ